MLHQLDVRKYFGYFWGGVIVLLPVFMMPASLSDIRFGKDVFFLFCCMLSLGFFGIRPINKKILIPLVSLMVLSFITVKNFRDYYSFLQFIFFNAGVLTAIQIISNSNKKSTNIIINAIAIAGIMQSTWFLIQFCGYDPGESILKLFGIGYKKMALVGGQWVLSTNRVLNISGSLTQQTLSGAFIAICSGALFRRKWWVFLPLNGYIVYYTGSAMSMVAFASTFYFYASLKYLNKRSFVLVSSAITIMVLGLFVSRVTDKGGYLDNNNRKAIWEKVIKWDTTNTLLKGKGLGYFASTFHKQNGRPGANAFVFKQIHNEFLEVYVALGITGIIIFTYLFGLTLKGDPPIIALTVLYSGLVNSFGNFPYHISAIALVLIACYSIIVSNLLKE